MKAADIIALVERHPAGLTSERAAEITGKKYIGSRLSQLHSYGKIARRDFPRGPRGRCHPTLWLPKSNGAAP